VPFEKKSPPGRSDGFTSLPDKGRFFELTKYLNIESMEYSPSSSIRNLPNTEVPAISLSVNEMMISWPRQASLYAELSGSKTASALDSASFESRAESISHASFSPVQIIVDALTSPQSAKNAAKYPSNDLPSNLTPDRAHGLLGHGLNHALTAFCAP
jgi:hypothetical protein